MSRYERYGTRDRYISQLHRTFSNECTTIDIDFNEYCHRCRRPLALIEACRDVGQDKPTTVIRQLAIAASIPAWLVMYQAEDCAAWTPEPVCRLRRVDSADRIRRVAFEEVAALIEGLVCSACGAQRTRSTPDDRVKRWGVIRRQELMRGVAS